MKCSGLPGAAREAAITAQKRPKLPWKCVEPSVTDAEDCTHVYCGTHVDELTMKASSGNSCPHSTSLTRDKPREASLSTSYTFTLRQCNREDSNSTMPNWKLRSVDRRDWVLDSGTCIFKLWEDPQLLVGSVRDIGSIPSRLGKFTASRFLRRHLLPYLIYVHSPGSQMTCEASGLRPELLRTAGTAGA